MSDLPPPLPTPRPADWETMVLVRRIPTNLAYQRKVFGVLGEIPNWFQSRDDYDKTLESTKRYLDDQPDDNDDTEVVQVIVVNKATISRRFVPASREVTVTER